VPCPLSRLVLAAAILFAGGSGCVSRRFTVVSDPPGALVEIDGRRIGVTPVSMDFTYYGTRNITLSKPGYQTLSVEQPQRTPWYQIFPFEFFSDNFALTHITDRHVFNYRMVPSSPDSENPGTLVERGRNFRSQAQLPQ
jgi:hypothetical protein